jgi:hypothetical protein
LGRRRLALRRLFLLAGVLGPLLLAAWRQKEPGEESGQDARIIERQARVTWDQAGHRRIIESLSVMVGEGGEASQRSGPLRLVQLGAVSDVRALGGDLGPRQIVYDPPDLMINDSIGPGELHLVFTYTVPEDAQTFEFAAALPVDEFVLEIQRGSVAARPGPGFRPDGEGGSAARPFRRYVASQLPSGRALAIDFSTGRVDWRQRLAVLFGTAAATGAVLIWVWRNDAARPRVARPPA